MSELIIPSVEKEDIKPIVIEAGGTAIILQRHERYQRDRAAEDSGSLFAEEAAAAKTRATSFFEEELKFDTPDAPTYVLFASSDTQYNNKGRRSLETGQLVQDACIEAMQNAGIDPSQRIININDSYSIKRTNETDQDIRSMPKLREPDIFNTPDYVNHLREKYGAEDGPGNGISKAAWAAHESDVEVEAREQFGAEGINEILDRTKRSVEVLVNYSKMFHRKNPNARLVIWADTHYDTISPLVKNAIGAATEDYVPVDYGAGVVIEVPPEGEPVLEANNHKIPLHLGKVALN